MLHTAARLLDDFAREVPRLYPGCARIRVTGHYDVHNDVGMTRLDVIFERGGETSYRLTDAEILMGGLPDVGRFLDIVERDICNSLGLIERRPWRWRDRTRALAQPQPFRAQDIVGRAMDFVVHEQFTIEQMLRARDMLWGNRAKEDKKAQEKARDLFISVAGREAFDTLEQGGFVLVIGGETKHEYELRKKASFCIRRRKDKADLCAVVPDVPLYDHLLGIKLMIEHEEARFLKTANVAGRMVPGGVTWVDAEYDDSEMRRSMFVADAMRIVNPPMIIGIDTASEVNGDAVAVTMTARCST